MLKLALLGGARGIAANVLWTRAEELQKVQDWDQLKATVDLITKLQPHFLSVWTFQGWNLAYNVSVEWDAPEDKYDWIKKGIKFLQDGVKKNQKSPDLIWDTAWTYYHKLGFSDESIILRRLFRDDDDEEFKTRPDRRAQRRQQRQLPARLRLVQPAGRAGRRGRGRGWPTATSRPTSTTSTPRPAQGPARRPRLPLDARPRPDPLRRRPGEESIVGIPATFGEVAKNEWGKALDEWVEFGELRVPRRTTRSASTARRHAAGPDRRRHRTPRSSPSSTENQQYWTNRWADQMNYRYWKDRCAGRDGAATGVEARQLFYEGTMAYKTADFPQAVEKFQEGLKIWDELLERAPATTATTTSTRRTPA